MVVQPLQLKSFQILLISGQIINEPIEKIKDLNEIIRIYGRNIISKISFYFHDSIYTLHNIILKSNDNNNFIIEFYQYYNQDNHLVQITLEEKINDFTEMMKYLTKNQYLNSYLIPYIINPFDHIQLNLN